MINQHFTAGDYFPQMSYAGAEDAPSEATQANAEALLRRVNALLEALEADGMTFPECSRLTSGWRSAAYNATIANAAPNSRHITGEALDIYDPDGALDEALFNAQRYLEDAGLWMEHPLATKGWCHLQSVPPRSGRRVFYP